MKAYLLQLPQPKAKVVRCWPALHNAAQRAGPHVTQIDADGQHTCADIPRFIAAKAQATPDAIINGTPVYDASVPKGRLYGRYLTHVWVWINTLSLQIHGAMCGFRVYPLACTDTPEPAETISRAALMAAPARSR